jgi:voltage-gated potassium channel Kch
MATLNMASIFTENRLSAWAFCSSVYAIVMLSISFVPTRRMIVVRMALPLLTVLGLGPISLLKTASNAAKIAANAAHYAEQSAALSLFNVISSVLIIILAFGLIYNEFGLSDHYDKRIESRFDAIYFSFITWTTVGFGDITPRSRLTKVFVVYEAMFGYLMLGVALSQFQVLASLLVVG